VDIGLLLSHHDSSFDVEHAADLLAAVARPFAVVAGGIATYPAFSVKLVVRHYGLADPALPQFLHSLLPHRFDETRWTEEITVPRSQALGAVFLSASNANSKPNVIVYGVAAL
jgi:hypothetical protein